MTNRSPVTHRLSTGHEVELPLELACSIGGVVVPARRRALREAVPERLSPLPVGPDLGCAVLVGIQYHRVVGGSADAFDPYDEFGVVVPAIAGDHEVPETRGERVARVRPLAALARLVGGDLGGYVHWLPVTTDASVALGREIWGYPKERADVSVTDGPNGIRTVVRAGGDRVCTIEVPRARGRERALSLSSYTIADGRLHRNPVSIEGRLAIRPGIAASVDLGSAVDDGPLDGVTVRPRPLLGVYGSRVRAEHAAGGPIPPVVGT